MKFGCCPDCVFQDDDETCEDCEDADLFQNEHELAEDVRGLPSRVYMMKKSEGS